MALDPRRPGFIGAFQVYILCVIKGVDNKKISQFTINQDLCIDIYDKSFIIVIVKQYFTIIIWRFYQWNKQQYT